MATMIVLAVLAAFGVLSVLWTLFGFLLPGQRGAAVVWLRCGDEEDEQILRHYGWLRDLGLLRCPMLLIDRGMTEEERNRLLKNRPGVEACTLEELPFRLEQERKKFGRTGT